MARTPREYHKQPKYQAHARNAQMRARSRRRAQLFEIKKELKCVYCDSTNPLALDFDHRDPSTKLGIVAQMATNGTPWERVIEEIAKCDAVCRNCHNIKSILEAGKMQGCDILAHIPDKLKHFYTPGFDP